MDQDMGQQASDWIMSVQPTIDTDGWILSWENADPMQTILSWVASIQQQLIDWLSGLNMKLDETKSLIEDGAKPKVTPLAPTPKSDVKEVKEPIEAWTWA